MSDLVSVFGVGHHPTPQQTLQHLRSISSRKPSIPSSPSLSPTSPSLPTISKSVSTGALSPSPKPAFPIKRVLSQYSDADGNMSTLPDPRSRTMSPANDTSPPSPAAHPDLSKEVETLSNKLISAINHQTKIDDTLSATKQELDTARARIKELEKDNSEHAEMLARGILIRKSVADVEKAKLNARLMEEKRLREQVEKEKKSIEQELENLTTALFEEANKMVITARESAQKEHDLVQKRNDQLKAQLADTESLLKSHQEQLSELKLVMEQMTEEREESTNPTAPSTPGLSKFDSKEIINREAEGTQISSISDPVSPSYPTSFTHLLQPVLRTDLSAYEDFTSILRMSKNIAGSRASSGSYATVGLGLGLGGYVGGMPHNGSSSSIATSTGLGSSPATPTTPASSISTASINGPNSLTPLKETKFYKRTLAEDIEPTLRLDTAPGLSWLARRTVLNAICEGTLVIEPMPASTKPYMFACSLCGEARKEPSHIRSHRFRTSENDNAQRYPLCRYCHGRVRSTCDFLGFLRIIKDGHWRAEDAQAEKAAWEECVRLREQMFWCRVGGGVVPTQQVHMESLRSPRPSGDSRSEQERELSKEVDETGEIKPKDVTPVIGLSPRNSTRITPPKRVSMLSVQSDAAGQDNSAVSSPMRKSFTEPQSLEIRLEEETEKESSRASIQSITSLGVTSAEGTEGVKRLSITIPGTQE